MAYHLTLTHAERRAIDWVGHRYSHGDNLYSLVWGQNTSALPDDADWDDERDITFNLPEHVAWQINDIGEEDNFLWTCFARELSGKLNTFCDRIV